MVCCSTHSREDHAICCFQGLCTFLEQTLHGLDVELSIPVDEKTAKAYCSPGVRCAPEMSDSLPLDAHMLWIQPLIEAADG
eukprot:10000367-Lingulodinium_polyedra.AAC.1